MTCPNYSRKNDKPFCRIYEFILSSKEKDCLGIYEPCCSEARRIAEERRLKELEELSIRRSRECPEIPVNMNFPIITFHQFPNVPIKFSERDF